MWRPETLVSHGGSIPYPRDPELPFLGSQEARRTSWEILSLHLLHGHAQKGGSAYLALIPAHAEMGARRRGGHNHAHSCDESCAE